MKIKKFLFLLIITLATTTAAIAQDHARQIDELVKTYQQYGQFNGTVMVVEKGKVILKKGYGMADMEWDIPNAADTKFRIGSVTKQFTAAIILQLVDEGKIKLEAKMTGYLTDYRKETGDKITIHQLLNHTSGIPSYTTGEFFREYSRDPYTVDEFVKKFSSGDLEFEPGSKFAYNNSGYFILGAIIEKVTGKTYAENLQTRILDPLGMKNTGYDTHDPLIKKRAHGYEKTPAGYTNAAYLNMGLPYAAGSMYSTVEDLFIWDQALYTDKVMSAASKAKMFTPGLEKYGYGVVILDAEIGKTGKTTKVIQHGGGINGFNCLFTRLVDSNSLIVILDNTSQGQYHTPMTLAIGNILYGQPYEGPKMSIGETIGKTYRAGGIAAAVKQYRELKGGPNAGKYDFNERELNTLGYQVMGTDKVKDAIEIFKLNIEIYPAAANPYDSLGEAYLKDGQKDLALKNYKKALELDPTTGSAKAAIAAIEGTADDIDPSKFDKYAGEYALAPGFVLVVTKEGDKLMGQATGQGKLELQPTTNEFFTVPSVGAEITFKIEEDGTVSGLVLRQGGQTIPAKKIK